MHSATNLRRLSGRAERAALAALAGGLRAERAMDAAHAKPTKARNARAERLRARAGELLRAWSAAQAEYDRERAEAHKALCAVERRRVPVVTLPTNRRKVR